MKPSPLLLSSLLIILSITFSHGLTKKPTDLEVFHTYNPSLKLRPPTHPSWDDTMLQMQTKDTSRLQFLTSLVSPKKSVVPIGWGRNIVQNPTYIVKAVFGTTGQTLLMALDISSDNAWIPCTDCVGCSNTVFSPNQSSTYKKVPCGAPQCAQVPGPICSQDNTCASNFTYGSSSIQTRISQDTLKLAQDPIASFTFGCIENTIGGSTPPQGLLGLGRGPLSLLFQTDSLYKSTFSYCLPNFKSTSFTGSLRLGPVGQPVKIKTTPLLRNPRRSSLYYVKLVGIKIGSKVLDISPSAFTFDPNTGAGTIFDSGTSFTSLVKPAYTAVRDEFRNRMGNATISSLGGFDTCYNVPIPIKTIPSITFMFDGMNVKLPQDNFLIHSSFGSTTCLAMAAAPDNLNSVLNVIASMQQQNQRIFYDIPNSRIGVSRQMCS
ncbi:protease [Lithospermum erythrorhizon]|uniref:Protease n=1 Tax=Lithospermum erythrorhizon TaxID=34254 RepID=A0AAV3RN92_LITER